jgi:hypothetical protein
LKNLRVTIVTAKRSAPQPAADDDTPQQEPKRQHVISADDNLRIKIPRFPSVPPSVSNAAAPPRMIIRPGSQQNPLEIRDDDEGVVKELKMMATAGVPRGGVQQQQRYTPTQEELTPQNRNTMAAALHYLSLGQQMSKNVLFPANQSQRAELFRTELAHAIKTFEELCVPGAAAIVAARRAS